MVSNKNCDVNYSTNGRQLNDNQKKVYEGVDMITSDRYIKMHKLCLDEISKKNDTIRILDIGGGPGYFAMALHNYFGGKDIEITVVDVTSYDTWDRFSGAIKFRRESAENIGEMFSQKTFDIVFAKVVFHHLVKNSYDETICNINDIIGQMSTILKDDGYIIVTEVLYNGWLFDSSASRIIYALTSCKIPFFAKIFNRLGSVSAGVGVCFLSEKMWRRLFTTNNLFVVKTVKADKFTWKFLQKILRKICLLLKNTPRYITFYVKKQMD